VEQLDLHRLVADLGLQTTNLIFMLLLLSRLQRRLPAGKKVITPETVAAVTQSSREMTSMSSHRSNRRMALVLRRAE